MLNSSLSFNNDLSSVGFTWLNLLKLRISKNFLQDEVTTHPDYPALTSFTDVLSTAGFQYNALQGDATSINDFGYPLLAHIKSDEQQGLLILLTPGEFEQKKQWTQYWTGVVLFAEQGASFQNALNDLELAKEKRNRFFTVAGLCMLIFFVAGVYFITASFWTMAFATLSGIGLLASILTLSAELGTQSTIVKQFCGVVSAKGCGAVLKSDKAKGIGGITPADLSIGWFTTQFLLIAISIFIKPSNYLLPFIFWAALLGLPVVIWSLWTQLMVVKQLCALCLSIVTVLIMQIVVTAFKHPYFTISTSIMAIAFLTGLIVMLAYLPIKILLKSHFEARQAAKELSHWKKDPQLFNAQLQIQPETECKTWQGELQLGNPNAPLQIVVACNTFCKPCANEHKKLDKILDAYPHEVCLNLRFTCIPENENDPHTLAVIAILQKAAEMDDKVQLRQMVTDWFEWMNLEKWKAHWRPDESLKVQHLLLLHENWMKDAEIAATPTLFVNGRKFPGRYTTEDLKMITPNLAELFEHLAI